MSRYCEEEPGPRPPSSRGLDQSVMTLAGSRVVERAEAVALGARAEGGVEAEAARLELGHVEAAVGAGHGGGKQLLVAAGDGDQDQAVGQLQSLGDGGFEALFREGLSGPA